MALTFGETTREVCLLYKTAVKWDSKAEVRHEKLKWLSYSISWLFRLALIALTPNQLLMCWQSWTAETLTHRCFSQWSRENQKWNQWGYSSFRTPSNWKRGRLESKGAYQKKKRHVRAGKTVKKRHGRNRGETCYWGLYMWKKWDRNVSKIRECWVSADSHQALTLLYYGFGRTPP